MLGIKRNELASTKLADTPGNFAAGSSSLSRPKAKDYFLWLCRRRQRFQINGPSMQPTIIHGEEVLVHPIAYQSTHPQLGDVVLVRHPYESGRRMVKRITEIVQTQDGQRFHVEGDNKSESTDSRSFGTLSRNRILGQVTSRFP